MGFVLTKPVTGPFKLELTVKNKETRVRESRAMLTCRENDSQVQ